MHHDDSITALRRAAKNAPMLDAATEIGLIAGLRKGSQRALRDLMAAHLRLVLATARRYSGNGMSLEDLVAEGNLGLVEAAQRFDPARGTRFGTYAAWWVRAFVRRYALANRRIVPAPSTRNARKLISSLRSTQRTLTQEMGRPPTRDEVAQALGVSADDVGMMESVLGGRDLFVGPSEDGTVVELEDYRPSPEQHTEEQELEALRASTVARALEKLTEREREIVRRRYLEEDGVTLAVLGDDLGLSRERVRQIEKRAQHKLRAALLEHVA